MSPYAPMEIQGSISTQFLLFNIYFLLPGDLELGRFSFSELNFSYNSPRIEIRCTRISIPGIPYAPMEIKGYLTRSFPIQHIYFILSGVYDSSIQIIFCMNSRGILHQSGHMGCPRMRNPVVPCAPMEIKGLEKSLFLHEGRSLTHPQDLRGTPPSA